MHRTTERDGIGMQDEIRKSSTDRSNIVHQCREVWISQTHKVLSFTHHSLPESGQGPFGHPDDDGANAAKNVEQELVARLSHPEQRYDRPDKDRHDRPDQDKPHQSRLTARDGLGFVAIAYYRIAVPVVGAVSSAGYNAPEEVEDFLESVGRGSIHQRWPKDRWKNRSRNRLRISLRFPILEKVQK